jgi:hypothetical protein
MPSDGEVEVQEMMVWVFVLVMKKSEVTEMARDFPGEWS